MELYKEDLQWALRRLPRALKEIMKESAWRGRVFVGGGFLRAVVAGESVSDVDVFVGSTKDAKDLASNVNLMLGGGPLYETDNAITVKSRPPIQIIHRWLFERPEDVSNSFDFTVCCAVISYDGSWRSYCDDRFYADLAARRLVYRSPLRNEDAGGSIIRVLKYYQRGYRIPLDSLGAVIARLVSAVDFKRADSEAMVARVVTGLLREVDPAVEEQLEEETGAEDFLASLGPKPAAAKECVCGKPPLGAGTAYGDQVIRDGGEVRKTEGLNRAQLTALAFTAIGALAMYLFAMYVL